MEVTQKVLTLYSWPDSCSFELKTGQSLESLQDLDCIHIAAMVQPRLEVIRSVALNARDGARIILRYAPSNSVSQLLYEPLSEIDRGILSTELPMLKEIYRFEPQKTGDPVSGFSVYRICKR